MSLYARLRNDARSTFFRCGAGGLVPLLGLCLGAGVVQLGCTESSADTATTPADAGSQAPAAAGADAGGTADAAAPAPVRVPGAEFTVVPEDFGCILNWQQVRLARITNIQGRMAETLAAASSTTPLGYPPGTIVQITPTEAMVKHYPGFSAVTNDWEFFFLGVSAAGTTIDQRGTDKTTNGFFGGTCFGCHSTAPTAWDLICETGTDHPCEPLPADTPADVLAAQAGDARCK